MLHLIFSVVYLFLLPVNIVRVCPSAESCLPTFTSKWISTPSICHDTFRNHLAFSKIFIYNSLIRAKAIANVIFNKEQLSMLH